MTVLLSLPLPLALLAQLLAAHPQGRGPAAVVADSAATVRAAQRTQAEFERYRRAHLPPSYGRDGGECDEQIGRFCYWYDDLPGKPPAERPEVGRRRDALLASLAAAHARLAGDRWLAGQRVRYLVEAGRAPEAAAVARRCLGDAAWCASLGGLALHAAGDAAAADSAFAAARAARAEADRCHGDGLEPLLDDAIARRYRALPCAGRAAFEDRWWWLARPLYGSAGNDWRAEYEARLTMARLHAEAATPYGLTWGKDLDEMMVRYGWPTAWSRGRERPGAPAGPPSVVGHDPSPAYHFGPARVAFDDPLAARADAWNLRPRRAPARYAPAYARLFRGTLPHQLAVFRRGDSALVVAAWDVGGDTAFARHRVDATLALTRSPEEPARLTRAPAAGAHGVLTMAAPWERQLLSLELAAPEAKHVARARYAIDPAGASDARVALSDLLLFSGADPLPASLEEALARVRRTTTVRRGDTLGLYWETYGLSDEHAPMRVSLAVVPAQPGLVRRAGELLRVVDRRTPLAFGWEERLPPAAGIRPRAITIDLGAAAAGRWTVELRVEAAGHTPVLVTRPIEIIER